MCFNEWRNEVPEAIDASSSQLQQSSKVSRGSSRRLLFSPAPYYTENGVLISNLTLDDCTKKEWNAPCAGKCRTTAEQDEIDQLRSDFLMVNTNALEDPDKPKLKKSKWPWIFWYSFQIIYMFCALAIVCDEFFVPALECFVDEFGISMDVAGATFMAAGGSMPELFTSYIATFKESEVGFAAIVGSAVFNVLFVIAVCAIASDEVLTLTWWPLARDCSFYLIALVAVVLVFSDNIVHWYEALALLCVYFSYCTFMKFNARISAHVELMFNKGKVTPIPTINAEDDSSKANLDRRESQIDNPHFGKPSTFRIGIVKLLTRDAYMYETAGIAAVTQIAGCLEDTFAMLDVDGDGLLSIQEMKELLASIDPRAHPDSAQVKAGMKRIARTGDGNFINFQDFKKWYMTSEIRITNQVHRIFDEFDKNRNGFLEPSEIKNVLKSLGHKPDDDEIRHVITEKESMPVGEEDGDEVQELSAKEPPGPPPEDDAPKPISSQPMMSSDPIDDTQISLDQFERWYKNSLFYNQKMKKHEMEEEADEGGLCLEAPDFPRITGDPRTDSTNRRLWYSAMFWWVFTYPLVCVMYCTLPDVRDDKYKRNWKMGIVEFLLSLVWIGIFSNWLYECIVVVSNTIGLPVAVSAVTVLAAGTSIPDLISSYVVAKKNEGDMAVSSSIGSNIFDVTVGLPLPWLSYTIIKGKRFDAIKNKTLVVDILVLITMVAAVIATVMCMKWRMTKSMGYIMLFLYFAFLCQNLIGQLPEDDPLVDYTSIR
jgi:K+-dependent Na+/Ca+ exchanger-like protein